MTDRVGEIAKSGLENRADISIGLGVADRETSPKVRRTAADAASVQVPKHEWLSLDLAPNESACGRRWSNIVGWAS